MSACSTRRNSGSFALPVVAALDAWREAPGNIGPLQHDPSEYALTIVGTPVWTWRMTPAVRAYLNETSGRIQRVAFLVTSGDTEIAKIQPSLEAAAGRKAVASAVFNARELADAAAYESKLSVFVEGITTTFQSSRRVA